MTVGSRNKRVELQRAIAAPGATGAPQKEWATIATVWAGFRTLSGNEQLAAQQVGATLMHEITLGYRPGVLPTDRIKYGVRIFDIKNIRDVDERHEELRLLCAEAV